MDKQLHHIKREIMKNNDNENMNKQNQKPKGLDIAKRESSEISDAQPIEQSELEDKSKQDCRNKENCMHCGLHCIYLEKNQF